MSDYLDLYDYRCRVDALYKERLRAFQAGDDNEAILHRFRQGRDEIFAHHPQSALDEEQRRHFQGLRYFPYNPHMRFEAIFTAVEQPTTQHVELAEQESIPLTTIGQLSFEVEGQPVTLTLYWLSIYGGGLFLPFRDSTCPQESYGGGRYLFDTIKGSDPLPVPGTHMEDRRHMLLDFNYAYNPSCAYNSRWVCPLAPIENRLTIALPAGEKKYKG